jgi:transposase
VSFNEKEIQDYRKRRAGFFCILNNASKDAAQTLLTYRAKEAIENCFDDLKNQLDMNRLRVHSPTAMDNRLFIQFLALILICQIRNVLQSDKSLRNLTVREVMEEMETIVKIKYDHHYGAIYTERSPSHRNIMAAFNLVLPA